MKMQLKKLLNFLWYDNSILSWFVNLILAFITVKYIIFPIAGLLLSTTHPMVAVISGSMEHDTTFNNWWDENKDFYLQKDITKEDFKTYPFTEGFNKGDIILLIGPKTINKGDVIVYNGPYKYPIIHRVVEKKLTEKGYNYRTKGDHNKIQDPIIVNKAIGKAIFRIPFLGYAKIIFTEVMEVLVK